MTTRSQAAGEVRPYSRPSLETCNSCLSWRVAACHGCRSSCMGVRSNSLHRRRGAVASRHDEVLGSSPRHPGPQPPVMAMARRAQARMVLPYGLLGMCLLAGRASAELEEVTSEAQFKKALSSHAAVAVDFYSQTCGPCIMIAPRFKELSREYEGKVHFVKVDVQRSYVGIQIRSMPTFHFYVQGKLEGQFSGADENGMRQNVAMIAQKAEAMDIEMSLGALEAFYQKHDPSKLSTVDELYEKYPAYKVSPPLHRRTRVPRDTR